MYDYYRKCLKCGSKKLMDGFGINKSGEAYKTCINCRTKDRVNRERYSSNKKTNLAQVKKTISHQKKIFKKKVSPTKIIFQIKMVFPK